MSTSTTPTYYYGTNLHDDLTGSDGDDFMDGLGGADTMMGRYGNDHYWVDNPGDTVIENTGEGLDTVLSRVYEYNLPANVEVLLMESGAYIGRGNNLDNLIVGTTGDNLIDGLVGADTMMGDGGNDHYWVDNPGDVVIENAGQGTADRVVSRIYEYNLAANVEELSMEGNAFIGRGNDLDNTIWGTAGNNLIDGLGGADTLIGFGGNDHYWIDNPGDVVIEFAGEGTADRVVSRVYEYNLAENVEELSMENDAFIGRGNNLDNTIWGTAANNLIDGLGGADTMMGGGGNDHYWIDNPGDAVIETAGEGTADRVVSRIYEYNLAANVEELSMEGNAFIGRGNDLNNTIWGTTGNNLIDGLGGADTMAGFGGNDHYWIDNPGDAVIEIAGEGTADRVVSRIYEYTLAANVEELSMENGAFIGRGNDLNNTIWGTAGNNLIDGLDGADTMAGGAGNDHYWIDNPGDVVIENAGEGTADRVVSRLYEYTLAANVEELSMENGAFIGRGNDLDNTIWGTAADNLIEGLGGNDTLNGGAGDDLLLGGDGRDLIYGEDGDDRVGGQNGDDSVWGGNGNDLLFGDDGNDVLYGEAGNDTLEGQAGNDTLNGGAGDDLLLGGDGQDMIYGEDGDDRVGGQNGDDSVWGGNGNDLLFGDDGDDVLYGEAGNDRLEGQAGNDTLNGGAGDDLLLGGAGNDWYAVDDAGDQVIENANEGNDTVNSSVDYILTANVENLVLAGSAHFGFGNDLNNNLQGNDGNNLLNGGAGADQMRGGKGDDAYYVDNPDDVVIEQANEGFDSVMSRVYEYNLTANVEDLWMEDNAFIGRGNDLNNTILGTAGNNRMDGLGGNDIIDGRTGADTMAGGAGNDVYWVDNAGDQVIENANEGDGDTVSSSVDYSLTANVENLALTGSAIVGRGNDLSNKLLGNDRNNVLDGGAGADQMRGGRGDDFYSVDNSGDQVTENANEGNDTVISSLDYTLTANVENLALIGNATIARGNDLDNTIWGTAGNNVMVGLGGDDILNGRGGDDILVAGSGDDRLIGGQGGSTTYVWGFGDGSTTIENGRGAITQAQGKVSLAGASLDQLRFAQAGDDLRVSSTGGATGILTVSDWFAPTSARVGSFVDELGNTLSAAQITAFVQGGAAPALTVADASFDTRIAGMLARSPLLSVEGQLVLELQSAFQAADAAALATLSGATLNTLDAALTARGSTLAGVLPASLRQMLSTTALGGLAAATFEHLLQSPGVTPLPGLPFSSWVMAALPQEQFTALLNFNYARQASFGALLQSPLSIPQAQWLMAWAPMLDSHGTPAVMSLLRDALVRGVAVAPNVIAALTAAQLTTLAGLAWVAAFNALTSAEMAAIAPAALAGLAPGVFTQFSALQLAALAPQAMTSVTAGQLLALSSSPSPSKLQVFSGAQLASLDRQVLAEAIATIFPQLTPGQQDALFNQRVALALGTLVTDLSDDGSHGIHFDTFRSMKTALSALFAQASPAALATLSAPTISVLLRKVYVSVWGSFMTSPQYLEWSSYLPPSRWQELNPLAIARLSPANLQKLLSIGNAQDGVPFSAAAMAALPPKLNTEVWKWVFDKEQLAPGAVVNPRMMSSLQSTLTQEQAGDLVTWMRTNEFYFNQYVIAISSWGGDYPPEFIAALDPKQLATVVGSMFFARDTLSMFTAPLMQAISASALTDLPASLTYVANFMAYFTPTQLSQLSMSAVHGLTAAKLNTLSSTQLQALTLEQVHYLSAQALGGMASLANFSPAQLNALSVSGLGQITAQRWGTLSADAQAALVVPMLAAGNAQIVPLLAPDLIAKMTAVELLPVVTLKALTQVQVNALTPAQVWAMTPEQLTALVSRPSPTRLNNLIMDGLLPEQFSAVYNAGYQPYISSRLALFPGAVTVSELVQLPAAAVASAMEQFVLRYGPSSPDGFSSLVNWGHDYPGNGGNKLLNLTADQVAALSPSVWAAVLATGTIPVVAMNLDQIAALGVSQIESLDPAVFAGLTPQQFRALTAAQLAALSSQQLQALSPALLNTLAPSAWRAMTDTQVAALQPSQLEQLNSLAGRQLAGREVPVLWRPGEYLTKLQTFRSSTPPSSIELNPTSLRNVYVVATASRSLLGGFAGMTALKAITRLEAVLQGQAPGGFGAQRNSLTFFKDYEKNIDIYKRASQGMRLVGSVLAVRSVMDAFYLAHANQNQPLLAAGSALQGLAWLASLMQVPVTLMIGAAESGAARKTEETKLKLEETKLKIEEIKLKIDAAKLNTLRVTAEAANFAVVVEAGKASGQGLPDAQAAARVAATAVTTQQALVTTQQALVTTQQALVTTQQDLVKSKDTPWNRFLRDTGILDVQKGGLFAGTFGLSQINNIQVRFSELGRTAFAEPVGAPAVAAAASLKNVQNQGFFTDQAKLLWKKNTVFIIADLAWMVNDLYTIGLAAATLDGTANNGLARNRNIAEIVMKSLDLVGAVAILGGDFLPIRYEALNTSLGGKIKTARLLGGGFAVVLGASTIAAVIAETMDYTNKDPSSRTPGDLYRVVGNSINAGLTVGMVILGMAVGGIAGAVVAGGVPLLLPNWDNVGRAIDINAKREEYERHEETVLRDIMKELYAMAIVGAIPVVNFFAVPVTAGRMAEIYKKMDDVTILQAVEQYLTWWAKGGAGQSTVRNLFEQLDLAKLAPPGTEITKIRQISGEMVKSTDWYGNVANEHTIHYAADLLVLLQDTPAPPPVVKDQRGSGWGEPWWTSVNPFEDGTVRGTVTTTVTGTTDVAGSVTSSGPVYRTLTDSGPGTEMVVLNDASNSQTLIKVDAGGSSQNMDFVVNASNFIIWGGSGINNYYVNGAMQGISNLVIHGGSRGSATNLVTFLNGGDATPNNLAIAANNFHGVLIQGPDQATTVTGTQGRQLYMSGGGADQVTMTGGSSIVTVMGAGTTLSMGNGGNLAQVVMGYSAPAGASLASYDGGAVAQLYLENVTVTNPDGSTGVASSVVASFSVPTAAAGTIYTAVNDWSDIAALPLERQVTQAQFLAAQVGNENTLDFGASPEELALVLNDPLGTAPSTVRTISGTVADSGTFTNFQNVAGSNLGDYITVQGTTHLHYLNLGRGNDDVVVTGSSGLTIGAGVSTGTDNIWLREGTVATVATQAGSTQIVVDASSSLTASLNGASDVVDASSVAAPNNARTINVVVEGGNHTLLLNDDMTEVTVNPLAANNHTMINDATGRSMALEISLGGDMTREMMRVSDAGVYFTSDLGDPLNAQTIDYYLYNAANPNQAVGVSQAENLQYVFVNDVPDLATVSVSRLIQAMSALPSSSATVTPQGQSWFKLADLVAQVAPPLPTP